MRPWPALPATPALLLLVTRLSAIDVEFYIGDKLVPLRYDPADDLHVVAAAFTERHDLDAGGGCADRACVVELLVARMAARRRAQRVLATIVDERLRSTVQPGDSRPGRRLAPSSGTAGCAGARAVSRARGPRRRALTTRARGAPPPRAPSVSARCGRAVLRRQRSRRRVGPRASCVARTCGSRHARTVVHDVARAFAWRGALVGPRRPSLPSSHAARAARSRGGAGGGRAPPPPPPARRRVAGGGDDDDDGGAPPLALVRAAVCGAAAGRRVLGGRARLGLERSRAARARRRTPRRARERWVTRFRPLAPRTCATRCSARRLRRRQTTPRSPRPKARPTPLRAQLGARASRAIRVACLTLDVLARAGIAALDVLVINAEGADLEILDACRSTACARASSSSVRSRRARARAPRRERREPAPAHARAARIKGRV